MYRKKKHNILERKPIISSIIFIHFLGDRQK
jgi:hypothetical protein